MNQTETLRFRLAAAIVTADKQIGPGPLFSKRSRGSPLVSGHTKACYESDRGGSFVGSSVLVEAAGKPRLGRAFSDEEPDRYKEMGPTARCPFFLQHHKNLIDIWLPREILVIGCPGSSFSLLTPKIRRMSRSIFSLSSAFSRFSSSFCAFSCWISASFVTSSGNVIICRFSLKESRFFTWKSAIFLPCPLVPRTQPGTT